MSKAYCADCGELFKNCSKDAECEAVPLDADSGIYRCEKCDLVFPCGKKGLKTFYDQIREEYSAFLKQNKERLDEISTKKDRSPQESALADAISEYRSNAFPDDEAEEGYGTFYRKERRQNILGCYRALQKMKDCINNVE